MIYTVHFNIPFGKYHGCLLLNPAMQEYEGKQVIATKPFNSDHTVWYCIPKNWKPKSFRTWVFHIDWLTPTINLL